MPGRTFKEGLILKDKKVRKTGDFDTYGRLLATCRVNEADSYEKESRVPKIPYLILTMNGELLFSRHWRYSFTINSCVT